MTKDQTISTLLIHDQRAGHLNPCLGILDSLSEFYDISSSELITPKFHRKKISLLKKLTWHPRIFKFVAQFFFKPIIELNNKPTFIICSGMPNLILSLYCSSHLDIPVIYVGDTRNVNDGLISATITALPQHIKSYQIILPTPPVRNSFVKLKKDILDEKKALLVLGGATKEHPFSEADFQLMVENFIAFCNDHRLHGVITNSRRTPLSLNLSLLELPHFIEFHNVHDQHAKPFIDNLQSASFVFVTEESTTMLAETIQSGRYVTSLHISRSQLSPLNEKYLNLNMMSRQLINENFVLRRNRNLNELNFNSVLIDSFNKVLGGNK